MNQTRKIVEGATLLALLGALMFIDVRFAGMFSTFIALILPVVIIVYTAKYKLSDGIIFAISTILFSFVSGFAAFNPESIIFYPIGIIVGILYSIGIKRDLDKRSLLFIAIFSFIIGEIIAAFLLYPLFGLDFSSIIKENIDMFTNSSLPSPTGLNNKELLELVFGNFGISLELLFTIIYIISTIFVGVMEGVIIHLFSVLILKRFKIKDLGQISLYDIKPNKPLAYFAFIALFSLFALNSFENQTIKVIIISLSLISLIVLLYYGYIFVMLYSRLVLKRNITLFLVLGLFFFPFLVIVLAIIGFLYGSGPLRTLLESKVNSNENNK